MGGWETVLAAVGGLVLGFGLGFSLARRREQEMTRRMRRLESRIRASVIPVLEDRAQTLGVSREERASDADDAFGMAVDLSVSIQRRQENANLAFSDTLEVQRADLERKKRK